MPPSTDLLCLVDNQSKEESIAQEEEHKTTKKWDKRDIRKTIIRWHKEYYTSRFAKFKRDNKIDTLDYGIHVPQFCGYEIGQYYEDLNDFLKGRFSSDVWSLVNWGRHYIYFNGIDYKFVSDIFDRYSKKTHKNYFDRLFFAFFYWHSSTMAFQMKLRDAEEKKKDMNCRQQREHDEYIKCLKKEHSELIKDSKKTMKAYWPGLF